jgi:hypothetical protein
MRMKSAFVTSAAPNPTGGADGTRSMYVSRNSTNSPMVSRKVAVPSHSRVAFISTT